MTVLALFLVPFWGIGIFLLHRSISDYRAGTAARSWPTVEGRVLSTELRTTTDSDGDTKYEVHVQYSYSVRGTEYAGDRIAFGYSGGAALDPEQRLERHLAEAKTVTVRVDPNDPSDAVLAHGVRRSTIWLLVFASFWTLIVASFTVLIALPERSEDPILETIVTTPR